MYRFNYLMDNEEHNNTYSEQGMNIRNWCTFVFRNLKLIGKSDRDKL